MATLLNADVIKQIEDAFAPMKESVHVMYFGQKDNCMYCADTQQLIEEVVDISDKLSLDIYDLDADADVAEKFNVDNALALLSLVKMAIRYPTLASALLESLPGMSLPL